MAKLKEEMDRLEGLLNTSSVTSDLKDDSVLNETENLEPQPLFVIDFDKELDECEKEARSMILKAIQHVFDKEQIKNTPYLKDKLKLDITSLGGMLYQNKSAVLMQKTLMEEIGRGAASPRHFEVFGNLSKTIAENNKQLLQTVEAIKSTYLGIRSDIVEKEHLALETREMGPSNMIAQQGTSSTGITPNGGYTGNSPKDMIKELKNLTRPNRKDNYEDVEEIK